MYQTLLTSLENGIYTLTINRPDFFCPESPYRSVNYRAYQADWMFLLK